MQSENNVPNIQEATRSKSKEKFLLMYQSTQKGGMNQNGLKQTSETTNKRPYGTIKSISIPVYCWRKCKSTQLLGSIYNSTYQNVKCTQTIK